MYKIIPPLQANMQGKNVANLQSALKILQENRFFRIRDQEQAEKIEVYWDKEVSNSLYGEATYELVRLVQEKHGLETSGEMDERTAEILNKILIEYGSLKIDKIDVDFPEWVINALDVEAKKIGVTRESIIKVWIAERLKAEADHFYTQANKYEERNNLPCRKIIAHDKR